MTEIGEPKTVLHETLLTNDTVSYRGVGAKFEVVRQILRLLASFIIRKVEQM